MIKKIYPRVGIVARTKGKKQCENLLRLNTDVVLIETEEIGLSLSKKLLSLIDNKT